MSGREAESGQTGVEFIRRLAGAWDCCGTCAGGVLLRHDRERMAEAWDSGFRRGESFANHGTDNTDNPYRTPPADSP